MAWLSELGARSDSLSGCWGGCRRRSRWGLVRIPGFGQPPLHGGARYPEDLADGAEAEPFTPQPGHHLHLVVVNPWRRPQGLPLGPGLLQAGPGPAANRLQFLAPRPRP